VLSDPISAKVGGVATNHPRLSVGAESNLYGTADGVNVIRVGGSSTSKRKRYYTSKAATKIAADPISAVQSSQTATITVSVNAPSWGFSNAELKQLVLDHLDFLSASTGANIDKILGGER
jgi:hypothetical protein